MNKILKINKIIKQVNIQGSMPDIDTDFAGERRDDVKAYIEQKYGKDYVASIGSYSTMKIKSSLKDLCREKGVDYNKTNFIVQQLKAETTFTELFKIASEKEDVKKFLQKNYTVIEKLNLCLNQPKSASVHASGVLIVPKNHGTIYQQMPVKIINGQLVSEWEGEFIDKSGFLKLDVLGIKQLDKLAAIFKLIKKNTKEDITFDDIYLNDPKVMQLFKDGNNEDVFQMGTVGLKSYCKELKPDGIDDLIAAVALYRPGTMETGAHKKYIRVKNKQEILVYDQGTETITKNTYGILIYQEQIMQVCSFMAGFTLSEADDIRKALGKKDAKLLDSYKDKFLQGCLKNGYTKSKIIELWDKMESFAKYSFNRSHAAAYAITGYYCQWLKFYYPIEYWTISMQYADEEDVINRISEINKVSQIEVATVDINKSIKTFFSDSKTIYWSITSVKWVGEVAVEQILNEREKNGEFYSLEEFYDRINVEGNKINKRCINNLILAGAFDKTERIKPKDRFRLLIKYQELSNKEMSEDLLECKNWKEYQWVLRQKDLTGYGVIDYLKLIKGSATFATQYKKFKENADILLADPEENANVVISGILINCYDKPFKGKGQRGLGANLEILDNTDLIRVVIWMDKWVDIAESVLGNKGKIIILSGKVAWDNYRNSNCIHSTNKTTIEII